MYVVVKEEGDLIQHEFLRADLYRRGVSWDSWRGSARV